MYSNYFLTLTLLLALLDVVISNCPPNEYFSRCLAHCQKNCKNWMTPIRCYKICIPGCVCKPPLVRSPTNKCIIPSSCPAILDDDVEDDAKQCPPKEHFGCGAHCQKTCYNWDKPIYCDYRCGAGCVCNQGLVRSPSGLCIKPSRCPALDDTEESMKLCPPQEHFGCGAHCQKNCSNWSNWPIRCDRRCGPGCVCNEGLVRSPSGLCIKPESCPATAHDEENVEHCPPKERFSYCRAHCQKTCYNWDRPIACDKRCRPGCVCKKGLVRNPSGKCVPPSHCPPSDEDEENVGKCPPKERFSDCNAHCQKTCSNWAKPIFCIQKCVPGCVCNEGLARSPSGLCIKPQSCPVVADDEENAEKCSPIERFSDCNAHCQKTCSNWAKPIFCIKSCIPGCVCNEGLVRSPSGLCIKPQSCPAIAEDEENVEKCPLKEHFSNCNAHCQKTCLNWARPIYCDKRCVPGCVCNEGLVRNPSGICIKPLRCPAIGEDEENAEKCSPTERFSDCNAHCQKTCSNWAKPIFCVQRCVPGCVCNEGLVRSPSGICIKPQSCPALGEDEENVEKCPPKERFSDCNAHCQKTCLNWARPIYCDKRCVPGCVCNEGLVRNPSGICINPLRCPAIGEDEENVDRCPRKEHFSQCRAHCQKTCYNWDRPIYCDYRCLPGCVCNKGLVRNPSGICVKPTSCPALDEDEENIDRCPPKERFSPCRAHCQKTCYNWDKPIPCDKRCRPGCICKKGLVRSPSGLCIKPRRCPPIREDD